MYDDLVKALRNNAEHLVFATYPPIPAWRCPKCGWRYEQRVKIDRVPFEPPKEEA